MSFSYLLTLVLLAGCAAMGSETFTACLTDMLPVCKANSRETGIHMGSNLSPVRNAIVVRASA